MTFRFFLRQTQVLGTTILLGSLAACTNKSDSDRTRTEGAATGAVVGAAVGAGTAAALKGKPGAIAGAAAAGAVVGGAAGAAYGDSVAKRKEGYAAKESALDSQITGIHQQVAMRRQYNEKLRGVVTTKEQQLATILASDRSAGPTVQEFDLRTSINSKLTELDHEARSWQDTIDAHKAVMQKATDDPHGADLQKEIDQLSEQRAELLRQRAKLAALPDKLKQ
ncbi:MAG: hypothetical protein ABJF10_23880 [Chthoniobacter sp.]|uniref:hypothetical protein n=1 Tax=Chthoniobacter sp. TaxID=2510640 RepID=UPI0032A3B727